MGWQLFLAALGGGIVTGIAEMLGLRHRGRQSEAAARQSAAEARDLYAQEGNRIREELRADLLRIQRAYDDQALELREQAIKLREQAETIQKIQQALREERQENVDQQRAINRLTRTNESQSTVIAWQTKKIRELCDDLNRFRGEMGLPPIDYPERPE